VPKHLNALRWIMGETLLSSVRTLSVERTVQSKKSA